MSCEYRGTEFDRSQGSESKCVNGMMEPLEAGMKLGQRIPCPVCNRDAAIQWRFSSWKGTRAIGDRRSMEVIDAENLAICTEIVDAIRHERGVMDQSEQAARDARDAARFRVIAAMFDSATTGRSERILEDLGFEAEQAILPLSVIVDTAIAGRPGSISK